MVVGRHIREALHVRGHHSTDNQLAIQQVVGYLPIYREPREPIGASAFADVAAAGWAHKVGEAPAGSILLGPSHPIAAARHGGRELPDI